MRQWRSRLLRLASVFGAGRSDAEIVEELRAHRELLAADYERSGMSPGEARRRAGAEFGSVPAAANAYQDRRGVPALEVAARDGRMAIRSLVRTPVLSLSMVIVLGLGIGLSTAIVAVFHAIAWAELPVPGAEAVARISQRSDGIVDQRVQGELSRFSYPQFETYRQSTRAFGALAAVSQTRETWQIQTESRPLQTARVTGDYFRVLPVTPAVGRMLTASDARRPVIVIGYRLWSGVFGAAQDIAARTMSLEGDVYTIVGVAPQTFSGTELDAVDVWLPLENASAAGGVPNVLRDPNLRWLQLLGRLAPGASRAGAGTEAALIAEQLDRESTGRRTTIRITPASRLDTAFERTAMTAAALAAATVALLFLICGSNAAALLVARGASQQREIGVRLALGAARVHIVRQLLAEIGVVAIASAGVGVLVCFGALQAFASSFPIENLLSNIRPDMRMFGFAFAVAFAVALVFGLAPIRQALRIDCLSSLKGEGTPFSRHLPALRLRRGLIAVQVTVSVVLLVVAAVMSRAVSHVLETSPGYAVEGLYFVQLDPNFKPGERPKDTGPLANEVTNALIAMPGVLAVAQATLAPFSGTGTSRAASASADPPAPVHFNEINPSYFEALRVPLVTGRSFLAREDEAVVINAALAKRFWKDEQSAVGKTLFIPARRGPAGARRGSGPQLRPMRVIGVAPTLQTTRIGFPDEPTYYTLLTEEAARRAFLLVRAENGTPIQQLVLNSVQLVDPQGFPLVTGLDAQVRSKTATTRLAVGIAGLVGLLALVVAAVGIHGLVSFVVGGRIREIGLYRALGASPAQVLRLVLGWTLRGVAIGAMGALVLMIALGAAVGERVQGLLYGVHPLDPGAFFVGVSVLVFVIGIATYLPARRALGMAPLAALRSDV